MSAKESKSHGHGAARVPDLLLERYRLNELRPVEMDRLKVLIEADPALRDRLRDLIRSDEEISTSPEFLRLAAAVRSAEVVGPRRSRTKRAVLWLVPAAAVGILAMAVVAPRPGNSSNEGEDRIKGPGSSLALYRRVGDGSEALADGAVVHAGDVVRIGYRAADRMYGAIVSVDGRGTITRHLPTTESRAVSLQRGSTVLLDQAYELDDAPMWERFYFVTADSSFDVDPIVEAVRKAALDEIGHRHFALVLPRGLDYAMFSLQKENRP